jgi:UDP-GlcNAc3NAcA epimerase
MLKIITLIGARPQFIKAGAISRAVQNSFSTKLNEIIVHSGQHYDANMSAVFFEQLSIPKPSYQFKLKAKGHSEQTAEILKELDKVLLLEKPDALLVYGDTNTTLAGALAASKAHIPLIHVEAGLRSFNKAMPEEINRIVTDHCSSLLFCPTKTAIANLKNESILHSNLKCSINAPKVYACGDIMYDNSLFFSKQTNDSILLENELVKNNFLLFTLHRPLNTDVLERLRSICSMLVNLAEKHRKPIVFPVHPRTLKSLKSSFSEEEFQALTNHPYLKMIKPVSFLEMITLEMNSQLIITDSGGVQKEAYFFKKPCLILRPETEWVEVIQSGMAALVDADENELNRQFDLFLTKDLSFPQIFGNGNSADFICQKIIKNLS